MDKKQLNWNEIQFIENLELLFGIVVLNWLQDIKDGNKELVPKSVEKAKEKIWELSQEWIVIPPNGRKKEWDVYYEIVKQNMVLIRKEIIMILIDELLFNKEEIIEIGLKMNWYKL